MKARIEVEWFAEQMERKLKANDHKPHWRHADFGYLMTRLSRDEIGELRRALKKDDWDRTIDEAADVANFAMMIADKARKFMK